MFSLPQKYFADKKQIKNAEFSNSKNAAYFKWSWSFYV